MKVRVFVGVVATNDDVPAEDILRAAVGDIGSRKLDPKEQGVGTVAVMLVDPADSPNRLDMAVKGAGIKAIREFVSKHFASVQAPPPAQPKDEDMASTPVREKADEGRPGRG